MSRWVRLLVPCLAALLLPVVFAAPAQAEGECNRCFKAGGGEGVIVVRGRQGVSDRVPGRGDGSQGRPREARDWYAIEEVLVPTCVGNTRLDVDVLCGAAVTSCAAADQIRFWVWHRRTDHLVGPPPSTVVGAWEQEGGTFCLGPDDPGVPNIVVTLARARDVFEQRVRDLEAPRVRSSPGPRTLVNYVTQFEAQGAEAFGFAVTVAGSTVHLRVRPLEFRWSFGDGARVVTTGPTVEHTYRKNRQVRVQVDVVWGGTFAVGSQDQAYDIDPPAMVTGVPSALTVVTARAENVTR